MEWSVLLANERQHLKALGAGGYSCRKSTQWRFESSGHPPWV